MTISIGDKFPNSSFKIMSKEGPLDISSGDIFADRKIILFALPGAFTPTCHLNHLPGFLENYELFRSIGVDEIYVLSVNDVWVMDAWAKTTGAKGKIVFLSDGAGDTTRALGMEVDLSAGGMGKRSRRYSMLLDDGVVKLLNIEEKRGQAITSGSATMLEQMKE